MIKLYGSKIGLVSAKITGSKFDFRRSLKFVKQLSVRSYKKNSKLWSISVNDISSLIKVCKQNGITVKGDKQALSEYSRFKSWRKTQLQCKDSNVEFSDMDILKCKLYPYQTIGAKFLYEAKNGILMDVVGLGKTPQSLSIISKHYQEENINFFIVICPNSLKRNWDAEVKKFTDKDVIVIDGNKPARKKMYKNAYKYDGMIINYDILRWDIDLIDFHILDKAFEFALILDEIQYVKNPTAKRSKLVKIISFRAKYSIGLSATVIENSLLDLWSAFQAIDETVLGGRDSYISFIDLYCYTDWFGAIIIDIHGERESELKNAERWRLQYENNPRPTFKKFMNSALEKVSIIDSKIENMQKLKERIKPYTIRRFKEDVMEQLPERIENNYWISLSPVQREFYDEVASKIISQISDMDKADKILMADVLPMISYLRQCVLSSSLVGHDKNISTKLDELIELVNSLDRKSKVLVFCTYTKMVDLIGEELDRRGIKNIAIHGQNCKDANKRFEYIQQFNSQEDGYRVLVTSDILREGHNITSANYIVNFDILWNPAKMEQRIGRVDRIGNKWDSINVINFIAENTIEENIFKIQSGKKRLSDDIINDNRVETRMTFGNIKDLFGVTDGKQYEQVK
jgi:SNF2 family DNA or RNA helicase